METPLIDMVSSSSGEGYVFITKWGTYGSGNGQFKNPDGVAVDSSGNVYVADNYNCRIQKFSSIGIFLAKWGSKGYEDGQFQYPQGIAADLSGNVYVTDTGSYRIQKFNATRAFIAKWGSQGSGDGQFESPSGIAVDSSGNIYVADTNNNRIQKFSSTGTFLAEWGSIGTGDGKFQQPQGVAVDSSGYVYVSDTNRIQKFTTTGTFLAKWGSEGAGDGQFNQPQGVAVDSSGCVYVADTNNNRIQKFNSTGAFLAKWGTRGSGDGQFNQPEGIVVDFPGYVFVADTGNNRIQKFMQESTISANFTAAPISGYAPLTVQFTDTSTGSPTSWSWDFGDDSTSATQSPVHTYTKAGIHSVVLTATNSAGSNQIVRRDYITVIALVPDANFTGTPTSGTKPLNVTFTDLSTNTPTSWNWDFGDGSYSTAQNPSHTFTSNRSYAVSLTVANSAGSNIRYVSDYITVGPVKDKYVFVAKWGKLGTEDGNFSSPKGIAVDSSGNVYVADPGNHRIQKFSSTGAFLAKWGSEGWTDGKFYTINGVAVDSSGNVYVSDWGLREQSEEYPEVYIGRIQKFSSDGKFKTTWGEYGNGDGQFRNPDGVAVDSSGNVYVADNWNNRIQKFSSTGGFITKWWTNDTVDFEESESPIGVAVDLSGNVYVTDWTNFIDNRIQKFNSSGSFITKWSPTASWYGDYTAAGIAVDSSGYVYVADPTGHQIRKYNSNGTELMGWGWYGSQDGQFKSPHGVTVDSSGYVYVADTNNNRIQKFTRIDKPTADFIANPTSGAAPLTVQFNDTSTGLSLGIVGWSWIFGDGNYSQVQNPVHTYVKNGIYTVHLTATNEAGSNTRRFSGYIRVGSSVLPPVANFIGTPTSGTAPFTVIFTDYSTNTPTSWNWNFGDGSVVNATVKNPVHTYASANTFTVSLNATNADGSNTMTRTNYITVNAPAPPPVANFTANVTMGLSPRTIQFTDTSTGSPTAWNWSFGDGALAVVQNPVHKYVQPGNHTVTLTASNALGANLTVKSKYITIYPKGDFNHKWKVDVGDAALVAHMVVNRAPAQIPDADFNNNGQVDIGDAAKIAYFVVGKITDL
jgi:PKD repeat protein